MGNIVSSVLSYFFEENIEVGQIVNNNNEEEEVIIDINNNPEPDFEEAEIFFDVIEIDDFELRRSG
jgi:hypothetical protein